MKLFGCAVRCEANLPNVCRWFNSLMTDRLPENLQEKLSLRLRYYQDIGIREFFRDRIAPAGLESLLEQVVSQTVVSMSYEGAEIMKESTAPPLLITPIPKIGEGTLQA